MEETPIPLEVSVVIVSYNCAAAIRRCLTALEASTEREKMEILVVDNGSIDGTPEAVAEFPHVVLLKLPRNFGFTKALNIGMRTAKADLFFYVSPYVEVPQETVSCLAVRIAAEPEATAVCPLLTSPEGEPTPELYQLPLNEAVSAVARAGAFTPAVAPDLSQEKVAVEFPSLSAFLVRSYFLKGLRYIDDRYAQSWADAELALQIRRAAKKIFLYPAIRAVRHGDDPHASSMPSNVRALLASDWALGGAAYAGKHFGFMAGIKVRLAALFVSLGLALIAPLRLRDVGFSISRFLNLVAGSKVDGTQSVM